MLTYRVFTQAFIADTPELSTLYYEGPDLEKAQRIYARVDAFTYKVKRVKPYATPDALSVYMAFERYPGRFSVMPCYMLEAGEVSTLETSSTGGIW